MKYLLLLAIFLGCGPDCQKPDKEGYDGWEICTGDAGTPDAGN